MGFIQIQISVKVTGMGILAAITKFVKTNVVVGTARQWLCREGVYKPYTGVLDPINTRCDNQNVVECLLFARC